MDDPSEFHDLFDGGATSTFDEPDALNFWDEISGADLIQSCAQSTGPSTAPHALQQQGEEDNEVQTVEEQVDRDSPLLLQEWDGVTEPSVNTLRYTVEWKAVLKTKRLGMNTEEDVFLSPGAFWEATLRHSLDAGAVSTSCKFAERIKAS